jgi:hypothetical protein
MSFALFLLLLSVPLGVLITVTPAWVLEDGTHERSSTPSTPPSSTDEQSTAADSSDHPATCLAIAAHRAAAYHAFIGVRGHLEDLDPMTWLVAGHLRDRFETTMLAAVGAVDDWLRQQAASATMIDARASVEHERLRETLAELIGSLPTFSASVGWEHHYRIADLQRLQGRLEVLAVGVERHRQVALHPPAAPFR